MAATLRESLSFYLSNCSGLIFERFDGKLAPVSFEDPGSVSRTIGNSEIQVDKNRVAAWNFGYTPAKYLYTRIEVKYRPVLPAEDSFGAVKYCQRLGMSGSNHNFVSLDSSGNNGSYYSSLLEGAYNKINQDRVLTVEARGIRNEETAEKLLRSLAMRHHKQLATVELFCNYSALNIEQWDKIGLSANVLPSFLLTKRYLVRSVRITPAIIKKRPGVHLGLIEVGDSATPGAEVWQDTYSSGEQKTDSTGGLPVQEGY